ncbi:TonB-dependent receptor domain-containing protein [Mesonia sp. K7]|uniref:TonB-dependent receptor domain-containing protein n=1 Tax=Mesonia sp. K7 TaxID=2218606 RepID=UPI001314AEE3|nr:TonB-dependent receptor [Mesonia sp. K7]
MAQYTVEGRIVDERNKALSYCNIVLYRSADSIYVNGTFSENDGKFSFQNIAPAAYFIKVSFVGFEEKMLPLKAENDILLPDIVLKESSSELNEITIKARKPLVQKLPDRLVFDIENTSLSSGNTWNVLKQTPGVIVLQDELKIRNTPATVYINDRKVYLSASELQQLLESYDAENIKQIEVMTNPSAKYDAADGPIINIVTSKMLLPGYKGAVNTNYTQAIFPKYSFGTSHFYKSEKLNIYGNYSLSPSKRLKQDESYIHYIDESDAVFSRWHTDFYRTSRTQDHQANFALDYHVNEKQKLLVSANTLFSPQLKDQNSGVTNMFNAQNELNSLFTTQSNLQTDLLNVAYDLGYEIKTGENSRVSANFHHTYYENEKEQAILTEYFDNNQSLTNTNSFDTEAYQKINIYTGQLDFETVLGKYNFASGFKYSTIDSYSFLNFYNVESDASTLEEIDLQNDFNYDEGVFAAYSSLERAWEKWNAKIGLRVENTDRVGVSSNSEEEITRNYTNLFPSAYLSYQISDQHQFSFDYGRKINRPNYQNLNPFRYFINENSFQSGNPNLIASTSHNFNLNYTFKDSYSFDFYFRDNGENPAELVFQDNENQLLRATQVNMLASKSYGIDFFHGRSLKDWWYSQLILSAFHEEETFLAEESNSLEFTNDVNGFYAYWYNQFTITKDGTFTGDISFVYISKMLSGSYQVGEMHNLTLGLNKKIWKKKAEISLQVADIFNKYAPVLTSTYLNQDNGYYALPENRYIRMGFKYNFGNSGLTDNSRTIDHQERERIEK